MSSFRDLANRAMRRFALPDDPPPAPTKEDKLLSEIQTWATSEQCTALILPWLDTLITSAEAQEDAAVQNHPLLLTAHGRVMALRQLRETLLNWSRQL